MNNDYKEIYLMLTEACPNRCEYCYIKGRDNPKSMTFEQIEEIIRVENPTRIIFFGGEPLLKIDLIEQVLEKYYGKIKFQVVTSTVVNFKEFIELDKKYPFSEIQLSWDGFSDKNRVDTCGNSISKTVYDNIQYAISQGTKFDVKCVIGNENIQIFDEIHKTFVEWKKKYNVNGEFVLAHRPYYAPEYLELFREKYKKTFTLDRMYMEHMNRIIAILQDDDNFGSCDVGKYKVITPYGEESYCTALSQEETEFDKDILQAPCTSPDCKICKYKCICDGGCRYERYAQFGDKWRENHLDATCQMSEIIYTTIREWIDSLDDDDYEKLLAYVISYKDHLERYHQEVTHE